jgi:hypothetical protein
MNKRPIIAITSSSLCFDWRSNALGLLVRPGRGIRAMPQKMPGNYGCFFTSADGLREQRVGGGERRSEAGRACVGTVLLFDGPVDRIDFPPRAPRRHPVAPRVQGLIRWRDWLGEHVPKGGWEARQLAQAVG